MNHVILLAGPSAAGKSTLATMLCAQESREVLSTSAYLRKVSDATNNDDLFRVGWKLESEDPLWLYRLATKGRTRGVVVDAVRSLTQDNSFAPHVNVVRVNVTCDWDDNQNRHKLRGTERPLGDTFRFDKPDYTWNSSRVSTTNAVASINQLAKFGHVDVIIGGQYGSEGKGKLAALIADDYELLVRSGGPNAGHWVRNEHWEFCYHHLPSGTMSNRKAQICIAAGATLNPGKFLEEVKNTDVAERLWIDPNTVLIEGHDIAAESKLVDLIGSTAQGVGSAASRRILRGLNIPVRTAADDPRFKRFLVDSVSRRISNAISFGHRVMLEGTQGSALSLFHGPYPYTTSRDTNSAGLLSECGVPPSQVRHTWMVVRPFPIRVGGNSGPMRNETDWEHIAVRTNQDPVLLKSKELTSTTKRQRRVGEFDWRQLDQAIRLNRPTHLFLTFADYIDPEALSMTNWASLPKKVREFCADLQDRTGCPVAGVSTGRMQRDVAWRFAR